MPISPDQVESVLSGMNFPLEDHEAYVDFTTWNLEQFPEVLQGLNSLIETKQRLEEADYFTQVGEHEIPELHQLVVDLWLDPDLALDKKFIARQRTAIVRATAQEEREIAGSIALGDLVRSSEQVFQRILRR